jgi:predicted HTH domain antitoxin
VNDPEEILLSLREGRDEFAGHMKSWYALKLCESQKLSIGQAASLADMAEDDFIRLLGQNRISVFGTAKDIAEDFQNA